MGSLAALEIESIIKEGYWNAKEAGQELQNAYIVHPEWFDEAFTGEGSAVNSGEFDGLPTHRVQAEDLQLARGPETWACPKVNYKGCAIGCLSRCALLGRAVPDPA